MRASRARSESGRCWRMELATPSAFRSLKIVLTKFPWRRLSSRIFATHPTPHIEHRTSNCHLIHSPISGERLRRSSDGVKLGGDELIHVVVRQANFDKIAHKIDRMGDYKPEIVYENANIVAIDPRDEETIAELNAQQSAQFVTVADETDLPVIAAFRLLAAKLQPRYPLLLKDVLDCRASVSDASQNPGVSQKRPADFLQTLLTASTN